MNVLICGIGGTTSISVAKQIRKSFPEARITGTDCKPKAIGFYIPDLTHQVYITPRVSDPDYWERFEFIIEKEKIDFAIVQPESEVLAWGLYYKEKGSYLCPTLIPPYEYTLNLMDKAKMADLLEDTEFIPKTITISPQNPKILEVEEEIGFPCWIRASVGSGGLGSLKIEKREDLEAWLLLHKEIKGFTVSQFLSGRHLANQMLYIEGECVRNAGLHCVEYVMADVAPSKVTGNTSFGRFLNEDGLLNFCEEVMATIARKLNVKPHGVFSFDLKEDSSGKLKVTEINIRHMAYTGIMSELGYDLTRDTVKFLNGENLIKEKFAFPDDYIFLREVDVPPILMKESSLILPTVNYNIK